MRAPLAAIIAIFSIVHLVNITPASSLLVKLPFVTCEQTISGRLVLSTPLEHPAHNLPVQIPAYSADSNSHFIAASVSKVKAAAFVVFQTCSTPGWNVEGETQGRIKLSDSNHCLAVIHPYDRVSFLHFEQCSVYQDASLQGQWFAGYNNTRGSFFLVPTGNSNNASSINRSHLYFNYAKDDPNPNLVSAGRSFTRQVVQFQITQFD